MSPITKLPSSSLQTIRTFLLKIGLDINVFFERKLGDGRDIFFWDDVWIGDLRLKDRFPRLYRIEANKNALVRDRVKHEDGIWSFSWLWSRGLTGRLFGELENLILLVQSCTSIEQGNGSWVCKLENSGVYKSRIMAAKLDELILAGYGSTTGTLRNKLIPQKVGLFIWRVLRERIPARIELDKRGVDLDSVLCPLCRNFPESVEHAMISCKFVMEIWNGIYRWWGRNVPNNANIGNMFMGDGGSGFSCISKVIWQAVEWVTASRVPHLEKQK
ncbi:uncharacterized protein [Rutidosis leptorrhynchoides]|uniref:uncharacterized protein n=1 Tax=Rutidosis leptorrhynchoides TaxID=125765 RepID=UPI003A99CBC6